MFEMYNSALDLLDADQFDALVVGSQQSPYGTFRPSAGPSGQAFCAGANLMVVGMMAMQGDWDGLDAMIKGMQDILRRAQYCSKPVVTAPYALVLGGGLEVAMACPTSFPIAPWGQSSSSYPVKHHTRFHSSMFEGKC